jgi:BASS family bile acid:Na+ symporter
MLTELETKLLGVMMMVIMLGMGASLTFRDFLIAFKKPKGVLIGMLCQYGIMPFVGYSLAVVLDLTPALAIGLILMGCMPGGTTSNIFAYFSKGVLALSIMMTSVSTLVAVAAVPSLIAFYSRLAGVTGEFAIPAANVAQVLVVLLVPTILGMYLRKFNPNIGATIELIGSLLGILVILFLVVSWVPRNYQLLLSTPWPVFFAAIALGLIGMLLGYGLARFHQSGNRNSKRPTGCADCHTDVRRRLTATGAVDTGFVQLVYCAHQLCRNLLVPQKCLARGTGARLRQSKWASTRLKPFSFGLLGTVS